MLDDFFLGCLQTIGVLVGLAMLAGILYAAWMDPIIFIPILIVIIGGLMRVWYKG